MSRRQRPCATGKVRYDSHFEGIVALWKTRAKRAMGHSERAEQRVYGPCRACNGWHLTSEDKRDE